MSHVPSLLRPARIRPTISATSAVAQLGALAVFGTAAILWAGQGSEQMIISLTLIYVTYAMAWNVVAGYAGQFTFGHAAFFGVGAFAATLMTERFGIPPVAGLWVGVLAATGAAVIIGMITLKLRGLYFGLVTAVFPLVFAVFANYLGLQEVSVPFNPAGGLGFFSPNDSRVLSAAGLVAALGVGVVTVLLVRSRFGLFFGALRADQDAAEAAGVATTRVKLYALALSAGLSAIAGALYASAALVVTPGDTFGVQMSVKPVLFSVFGGIGTLLGPVVGAAILVPLSEWLTASFGATLPGLSGLVYGSALLLVITLFPDGIVPVTRRLFRALWQRSGRSAGPDIEATTTVPPTEPPVVIRPSFDPGPILAITDIRKSFGGTRVLLGISFVMQRGEILGVIGPNGAGKTTLFNVVNGFLRPDSGTVTLGGRDVTADRPSEIARTGLGRTFQTARMFSNMSVMENVLVGAFARGGTRHEAQDSAWGALGEVGLAAVAHKPVDGLTTGETRRLELARAFATAGPGGLLLLDEFLGGLTTADGTVLLAALRRFRDRGGSVLAIEHTMRAMAGFVDRFVVLNFGEVIADGPPDAIWANRDVVKAYLGDKWVA